MATRRSNQRRDGRYVQGGKVELRGNRLGWWERKIFPRSQTDVQFYVTKKYASRPDLVAYDVYGRSNLMWFVLQYNNISDVEEDFIEGKQLTLPTAGRLFGELLAGT